MYAHTHTSPDPVDILLVAIYAQGVFHLNTWKMKNNIVTILSNMNSPVVLTEKEGVFRRKRDADGKREKISSAVKIPEQTKAYMSDFRQIDQRNPRTPYCFCRYEHGSQCYCSCKLGVKDDARNFFSEGASVHATKKVTVAATPKYGK